MSRNKLYLIGTNHFDMRGPERLINFLDKVKPSYVVVEGTTNPKQVWEKRKELKQQLDRNREALEKKLGAAHVAKLMLFSLSVGYESWVPGAYAEVLPDTVVCATEPVCFGMYDGALGLVGKMFVRALKDSFKDMDIEGLADYSPPKRPGLLGLIFARLTDRKIEAQVRKHHELGTGVVVAGTGHIFAPYYNLTERLSDLEPVSQSLIDVS